MDVWILLLAIAGVAATVEVHFENRGGGFFLKHSPRSTWSSSVADLAGGKVGVTPSAAVVPPPPVTSSVSTVFSVDRFTVFLTSQPVSVRATYGPFSTKQTVPARSLVPMDEPPMPDARNFTAHGLDVSAHLVRPDIPRDAPVLRVLFHTGGEPSARRRLCILLQASLPGRTPLTAACSPDGEDGVCLVQLTIPASWWPPLPPPDRQHKPLKTPQRLVQIAYSVLEPRGEKCVPRVQIQPATPLTSTPLVPARANYKEVRTDDALSILLPHAPLYPLSHLHVPVFLLPRENAPITAFVLRARVKSGLRILSVEKSSDMWNVTVDVNARQKVATVTCVRKETDVDPQKTAEEVLTWLLEVVEDGEDLWDGGRVVWSAQYYLQGKPHHHHHRTSVEEANKKLTARLEIQKDDIQSVLPISKNWEVINTAVLTGHQVSQAMKVLIVSQAGKVADVTLQSSCHSEDESVLKVSSSCSSVYVDGSELRGSSNASVLVKYGTYTGLAEFLVWMPEFPLELSLPDVRLSQVKGWRVPDPAVTTGKRRGVLELSAGGGKTRSNDMKTGWSLEDNLMESEYHPTCRVRFQQTPIEVYARFLAEDHDSGRLNYFGSRRTWLRVTDLVLGLLRVADPRIASLHGRVVQGRSVGRTEVQVLSPITGRVIGAKEVRVGNDKVSLERLVAQVVSGLQLTISPDSSVENGYIAETSVTRRLTAQYQEGLLDIELEWSDATKTPLRDVAVTDYHLLVDSLDPDTVAFAPMVASHHPRVIAVGEGRGELLRVALLPPDECQRGGKAPRTSSGPLAQTSAAVEVDFGAGDMSGRTDFLQNDGHGAPGRDRRLKSDLGDILRINGMTPLKDENNHEPTVQARQLHGSGRLRAPAAMTPLEIGMYVLLAAFCFAIVVFVVSCVVYASKFKPQNLPPLECTLAPEADIDGKAITETRLTQGPVRDSTTDARDWVWLGRATLDRTAAHNGPNPVRITENPMAHAPPIDTSTFCKSTSGRRYKLPDPWLQEAPNTAEEEEEEQAPPVPPHGARLTSEDQLGPPHGTPLRTIEPPIPPHGAPMHAIEPPVPPHGVPLPPLEPVEPPPPRRHRHHHHRSKANNRTDAQERGEKSDGVAETGKVPTPKRHNKHRHDPVESKNNKNRSDEAPDLPDPAFVEFPPTELRPPRTSSMEVKRATVISNPSYTGPTMENPTEEEGVGLDDLNLGMNYDQIMLYFDNLKESNA